MAGQVCRIFPPAFERPSIRTAGCNFRLGNSAIPAEFDSLDTALPAERRPIGMAVIKNEPFTVDLGDAAMVIAAVIHRLIRRLVRINMKIAIADNDSLVGEASGRMLAGRIAQLMHGDRGIDKVVGISPFADGRRFKELVAFESAPLTEWLARRNKYRLFENCEHIRAKHRCHCAVSGLISIRAESGVQVGVLSFGQHAGVKLRLVAFPLSKACSIGISDIAVELILAARLAADRYRNDGNLVQHIVEIIPPVRSHGDIGCIQAHAAFRIQRVIRSLVDYTLIPPFGQIVLRCRPADIVIQTKSMSVKTVMRAIHIHSSFKNIRLAVRDIFPGREVRIESLFFCHHSFILVAHNHHPYNYFASRFVPYSIGMRLDRSP
ncbi:hypothetical protein D3C76_427120 [compost metagenome]